MVKTFEYKLDGEKYNVEIVIKNNKNTYIKVKDDLTIYVTTNIFTSKRYIKNLLDQEQDFLRKVLKKVKQRSEKENDFYYLGRKYDIIKVPFKNIEIDDDKIYVNDEALLEKWLKKQMKIVFEERLNYCYSLFEENIPFPKLKTRKMKTRWGVCNKRDLSVTLNSKLIRYDQFIIDYVIIHELSHLVHFDHSREFWNTVGKYMPDYKKAEKVLKE
ncbi:MAG: M48 family metallopeptidase [Bacilli bacterium]|nr:M48 family metallopeptidase [Bacilli bacterium]